MRDEKPPDLSRNWRAGKKVGWNVSKRHYRPAGHDREGKLASVFERSKNQCYGLIFQIRETVLRPGPSFLQYLARKVLWLVYSDFMNQRISFNPPLNKRNYASSYQSDGVCASRSAEPCALSAWVFSGDVNEMPDLIEVNSELKHLDEYEVHLLFMNNDWLSWINLSLHSKALYCLVEPFG